MDFTRSTVSLSRRASGDTEREGNRLAARRFPLASPVVVLVDHWTGSMGEGIAIGMDGLKRATIVGTEMAGLLVQSAA